ncbi:DCC1-like thiol-disulfide oxidoreductase family protein [Anderseniella sp. Alg231-50]|uniref:DCC1-like thiol-disulfide oxidoreductase family protein n=1 Tax=Anderseniella sp. Alg231-50 TaxID=1922226 RepID=UPI000D55492A
MTETTEINFGEVAPVWLFDGVCVLCNGAVQYTLKHEKEPLIRFVSIQSVEGRQLAVQHGLDPDDPQSFLFVENGKALARSDGVLALARHLDGPARLISWCRFLPKPLRDFAYDRIARNRYRLFGRKSECPIPDAGIRHRFVL